MAGFLGFGNYSKPGPGIGKDEPQKHSFFVFFDIFIRKFWKLIEINLLFCICCIPFFIPFVLTVMYLPSNAVLYYISLIPLIGIAVNISGLTYILRNFTRQEHAFLWMDFKDTVKKNWRQSLIVGAVDFVVIFLLVFSIRFYYANLATNGFFVIPFALCILFTIIITFMHYYIFVMLITFDLKIKQIFKNAFIFSFAGVGHNILITLFCGIIILIAYSFWPVSFLFIPFITISLIGFIIVFNVWPTIKKFMIPELPDEEVTKENAPIFEDTGKNN